MHVAATSRLAGLSRRRPASSVTPPLALLLDQLDAVAVRVLDEHRVALGASGAQPREKAHNLRVLRAVRPAMHIAAANCSVYPSTPLRLVDLVDRWLEEQRRRSRPERREISPKSVSQYEKRLAAFGPLGQTPVDLLDDHTLEAWVQQLRERGAATARHAAKTLQQALLWGRDRRLVRGRLRVYVPAARPEPGEPLTLEEHGRLVRACLDEERRRRNPRHCALQQARETAAAACVRGLAYTGLRPSALGQARGEDLDVAGSSLQVATKPRRIVRVVVRGPALQLLVARRDLVLGVHEHLFPGAGDEGIGSQAINAAMKRLLRAAELPDDRHPYDLRHTIATLLRLAGASWAEVAEYLGHLSPATTRRTYDHTQVNPTTIATADRLAAFLLGGEVGRG